MESLEQKVDFSALDLEREEDLDVLVDALEGTGEFNEEQACRIVSDYLAGNKTPGRRRWEYALTAGAAAFAGVFFYPAYRDLAPLWLGEIIALSAASIAYFSKQLFEERRADRAERKIIIALVNEDGKRKGFSDSIPRDLGLDCREYCGNGL